MLFKDEFSKVILQPIEINFPFHTANLFLILPITPLQEETLLGLDPTVIPKKFKGILSM